MGTRKKPSIAVDILIRINDGVVLVERKNEPYEGKWAIPGGFVEYGEKVEDAACREAKEETGLEVSLEGPIDVYSKPGRDPRGHVISILYLAKKEGGELQPDTDAEDVKVFKKIPWNNLAFDHEKILREINFGVML